MEDDLSDFGGVFSDTPTGKRLRFLGALLHGLKDAKHRIFVTAHAAPHLLGDDGGQVGFEACPSVRCFFGGEIFDDFKSAGNWIQWLVLVTESASRQGVDDGRARVAGVSIEVGHVCSIKMGGEGKNVPRSQLF